MRRSARAGEVSLSVSFLQTALSAYPETEECSTEAAGRAGGYAMPPLGEGYTAKLATFLWPLSPRLLSDYRKRTSTPRDGTV